MGLRETAEKDAGKIINDARGFSYPVRLTNPAGSSVDLSAFTNDISQLIDPDTNEVVSGRAVTVLLHNRDILNAGFTIPRGIADTNGLPYILEFLDINGNAFKFKVAQSDQDRGIGLVALTLEVYK